MNFNFWLELPTALINLFSEIPNQNEYNIALSLLNTSKTINQIQFQLVQEVERLESKENKSEEKNLIQLLMLKMKSIEKQKSDLLFESIKISIKISNQYISLIDQGKYQSFFTEDSLLLKIKYFLCLIKYCNENIQQCLEVNNRLNTFGEEVREEASFCQKMKLFFQKLESRLYFFSLNLINSSFRLYENVNNKDKKDSLHEEVSSSAESIYDSSADCSDFQKKRLIHL